MTRCFGEGLPYYEQYHDHEWGKPEFDDIKLFELLCLEGAQAGLNWALILKKRNAYQKDFFYFDPKKVAQMTDKELLIRLQNPLLIRNRLKIFSVRSNARVFLSIQNDWGSFSNYLWSFVQNKPIINEWKTLQEVPVSTSLSEALSKDLKKRNMTFVGPKIIYSYMQAAGLINDHLLTCPNRF